MEEGAQALGEWHKEQNMGFCKGQDKGHYEGHFQGHYEGPFRRTVRGTERVLVNFLPWGARRGGRTLRKGVFQPPKHLLSAFYDNPSLLRTLLRKSVPTETLTRRLLRTLLRCTSFKDLFLRTLLRRVVA